MQYAAKQRKTRRRRQAEDELAEAVANAIDKQIICDRSRAVQSAAAELIASIEAELTEASKV